MHDHPHSWTRFLALAEWSYNTSVHSATGLTPFEVTYGKPPPSILQYLHDTSQVGPWIFSLPIISAFVQSSTGDFARLRTI